MRLHHAASSSSCFFPPRDRHIGTTFFFLNALATRHRHGVFSKQKKTGGLYGEPAITGEAQQSANRQGKVARNLPPTFAFHVILFSLLSLDTLA
jgi:hypothetical protein